LVRNRRQRLWQKRQDILVRWEGSRTIWLLQTEHQTRNVKRWTNTLSKEENVCFNKKLIDIRRQRAIRQRLRLHSAFSDQSSRSELYWWLKCKIKAKHFTRNYSDNEKPNPKCWKFQESCKYQHWSILVSNGDKKRCLCWKITGKEWVFRV